MTAAIEVQDLHKIFRKGKAEVRAVDGLDLSVRQGEVFGLLGPNGAGKTTTVEICEGLAQPTSGVVRILGSEWSRRGFARDDLALRQRLGVTLQETRFFEKQTVREVVTLFHSFYDHGRSVDECLDLLALREKAAALTKELSGGQRQRLAVACALVGKPDLLFLDEPTTGLDPQSRRQLWDVVRAFRDGGGTVLLTTHYMDEAEQLCDRIAVVDRGKRIALGSPAELIASLGGEHVIELGADGIQDRLGEDALARLPEVRTVRLADDAVTLTVGAPHRALPALLDATEAAGLALDRLSTRHASLEDVFVALTGRHLREGDG